MSINPLQSCNIRKSVVLQLYDVVFFSTRVFMAPYGGCWFTSRHEFGHYERAGILAAALQTR